MGRPFLHSPTGSQWRAIRAADRHVLVAAGAGTGKTTTVVGRVLWLLGAELEGERCPAPLALHQVAAITYTNAAAADLKRKLRESLRLIPDLQPLAYEVDNARIGTIHSFCGDILREFALRSGRDPSLRVLEEGEAAVEAAEVARETLLEALEESSVPGLDALLAERSVAEVERWACRLAGEGDRLDRIAASSPAGEKEAALVAFARLVRDRLVARLEARGAMDFDRMIVWTRELLARRPPVRRALQRRIRTLVVDEFQDVDPVQKEIAWLLAEPESGRADTTRLMLVGDPKQSIYRFRRADVTVWRSVQEAFERDGLGLVCPLEDNWRSTPAVLAFVDAAVAPILDRPVDGTVRRPFEVDFHPVTARRDDGPGDLGVECIVIPRGPDGKLPKAAEQRAREAEAVARRARELHDQAGVPWSGIALLFAAWTDVEIYRFALERAAIPGYVLRSEGFYESRAVQDLVLALETLRDPHDDRALLGFLRSPFAGLRDETLLEIALGCGQPYWDHLDACRTAEPALLGRAVTLLRDHIALRDRVPTHELLESLLERSGYLAHLALLGEPGLQPLADVRKFVRLARLGAEQGVGDFLRLVRESRDRGDREGPARLYGEHDDVVTLTTIHSAKGLEWDVVFWCDLGRALSGVEHRTGLLVGHDRLALRDPIADEQPLHYRSMALEENAERAAEARRLWYVAATRARHRLVLAGIGEGADSAKCPGGAINAQLGGLTAADGAEFEYTGQGGRRFHGLVRLAPPAAEPAAASPEDPWTRALPQLHPAPPPLTVGAGRARHSATSLMTHDRCPRRHWFRYVAGLPEPPVERGGQEFAGALERGQIVHDVLEHLAGEAELDRLLEAAITRRNDDAPGAETASGRRYRERLREEVGLIAGHPAYRALDDRPGRRRELQFLRILPGGGAIEGKIDLAVPGPDGLELLDVKTTPAPAAALERKAADYAIQRDVYIGAAEAIGGRPVSRFVFHFSRAGAQVEVATDPKVRADGAAGVTRLLESVAAGGRELTTHPAECRFCGYKAAGWCQGG